MCQPSSVLQFTEILLVSFWNLYAIIKNRSQSIHNTNVLCSQVQKPSKCRFHACEWKQTIFAVNRPTGWAPPIINLTQPSQRYTPSKFVIYYLQPLLFLFKIFRKIAITCVSFSSMNWMIFWRTFGDCLKWLLNDFQLSQTMNWMIISLAQVPL